jgi:predicted Zn finger-like uncharacterized protein
MRVECPKCHAAGEMNDAEIPVSGRLVVCPKCGNGFQVKPPAKAWSQYMMNTCPKCGYSTFSEETFAVCPKCGLDGEQHHRERQRQEAAERSRRAEEPALPPPSLPPSGSKYSAQQVEEEAKPRFIAPPLVQAVGWTFAAIGLISLFSGLSGLGDYYGTDWQKAFSEETGEQISGIEVFFLHGFSPWVKTLFGGPTVFAAAMFLQLKWRALAWLEWSAWALLAMLAGKEVWDAISWIRRSSSDASLFYYLTGLAGGVLMLVFWTALILGTVWFLRSDRVTDPFKELGSD